MNDQLLSAIAEEIRENLKGRRLGKIFQLGPLSFAIDFGLKHRYLYLNVEPASPRLYLIERKVKELEKQSLQLSFFGNTLRAKLGHGELIAVEKYYSERVIHLSLKVMDEIGQLHFRNLIAQLTGRAANLFITDELNSIVAALRAPKGHGQQLGENTRRHQIVKRSQSSLTLYRNIPRPQLMRISPGLRRNCVFVQKQQTREQQLRSCCCKNRNSGQIWKPISPDMATQKHIRS